MLELIATECGSRVDGGTMICGASNSTARRGPYHSFILMRGHRSLDDDDGPYFELDDQSQGFHRGVVRVVARGDVFTFELRPPPGLGCGHRTVVADLGGCPAADVRRFRRALLNIFRDQAWRLDGIAPGR